MNSFAARQARTVLVSSAFCFAALLCCIATLRAQELKPMFNGTNLDGWIVRGGKATYAVEDGVIVGTVAIKGGGNTFLCTEKEYGDFILELEIKADADLNSGVQIRSHCFDHETTYDFGGKTIKIAANRVHGYQVEVDHRPERRWSGGIYEEGRREWLFPLTTNSTAGQAFKFGEWNKYRIACFGDSIKTWINGVPAADLVDSETLKGLIGLQVHATDKPGLQVRFRNVRLQDLGQHEWKPLWNGKNFDGAHIIGNGDWKIEDGVIHATHAATEKEFGHLVSDETIADFTVRLNYKAVKGNSGVYFRCEETGPSGISGFQAEIDATQDAGGLYETNGRSWVAKPMPEDVKKWFKPQDWNAMTISAHGPRITVDVNGHQTAELRDDPGRRGGHLALQVHANQDCDFYFKDIEILSPAE